MWTPEEKLNYIYAFMKYDMKSMELDFWQDRFIKSRQKYISILKSRRTGFSFATALKGMVKAQDPARTNYVKQFVSYNESDAVEKIRYARAFYDSMPKQYKKKLVHANSTEMEFLDANGKTTSRLISLPCRPPRGKGGDISLDEYAIYLPKVSDQIYTAALFVIMRGGCIEVGSTPLGTVGKFYEICTDKDKFPSYERYTIPWWFAKALCADVERAAKEAPNMGTAERVMAFGNDTLKNIFANSTLEDFQQECECTFIDSASSYISLELIYSNTPGKRECDYAEYEQLSDGDYWSEGSCLGHDITSFSNVDDLIANYKPEIHGSPLFAGYDVGHVHDAASVYVIGRTATGKKRSVLRLEMRNTEFEAQAAAMNKLLANLPVFRACMDCTGMGAPLSEKLGKRWGEKVEGVTFTVKTKEALAMAAKFGLERREFLLENDRDFHAQIHSIKRTPTTGGNFRYDAERNEKGHADSFWSWALANHAADGKGDRNFYEEYAEKKRRETDGTAEAESGLTIPAGSVRRRGHSLQTVLNKIERRQ